MQLHPNRVGVTADQRGQLLGGRGSAQLRERLEQPGPDGLGQDVVLGGGRDVHQRLLSRIAPFTFFFPDGRENRRGIWQDARRARRSVCDGSTREERGWTVLSGGSSWSPRGGSRRRSWSCCADSSSSACWPTAPTWPTRRCRARWSTPQGRIALHGQGHPEGPAGLPAQRPHGVRVGVRPRRLSRARLHRRLPAPRVRSGHALLRRTGLGLGRAPDDRGLPHQPLRQEDGDAHLERRPGPAPSTCWFAHYSAFFSDPKTEHGLRPNAITDRTQLRQLTAFFAWTAWAASTDRPGHDYSYTNNWPPEPRVDNHADGQRDRVVGAVADRAAGRHRPALRRLRALGAPAGLARARAGDAVASARPATSR